MNGSKGSSIFIFRNINSKTFTWVERGRFLCECERRTTMFRHKLLTLIWLFKLLANNVRGAGVKDGSEAERDGNFGSKTSKITKKSELSHLNTFTFFFLTYNFRQRLMGHYSFTKISSVFYPKYVHSFKKKFSFHIWISFKVSKRFLILLHSAFQKVLLRLICSGFFFFFFSFQRQMVLYPALFSFSSNS